MLLLSVSLFPLLMVVAGTGDVLSRTIPNRLTLVIALFFFPLALGAGMPWPTILLHAATGMALLAAGYVLFALGFLGGGDAKLLGAAGIWFGVAGVAPFLTMTVIAGGVLSLCVLAWSLIAIDAELRGSFMSRGLRLLKPAVPYGYAIAAGALLAYPQSWWGALIAR